MSLAWLLNLGEDVRVAVGGRELVHLLYAPESFPVPSTPGHARHVMPWQEHLLPVLDLASWLTGKEYVSGLNIAGVFAYQDKRGDPPRFGALWLAAPPTRLVVGDHQACDFPEPLSAWETLAVSCFEHEGSPLPILDLPRIYATALI